MKRTSSTLESDNEVLQKTKEPKAEVEGTCDENEGRGGEGVEEDMSEDDVEEEVSIESIATAALCLIDSFASGETNSLVSTNKSVEIDFVNQTGGKFTCKLPAKLMKYDAEAKRSNESAEFAALLKAAEISPFGHGKITKINPTVRNALHVPANRISAVRGFNIDAILEEVRAKLFPNETSITAEVNYIPTQSV